MSTTTPTTTTPTTEPASASALREVTTNARVVEDAPERVMIRKEETRPMTTEKREREEDDEAVGTVEAAPVATKRGKGGRQVETAPRERAKSATVAASSAKQRQNAYGSAARLVPTPLAVRVSPSDARRAHDAIVFAGMCRAKTKIGGAFVDDS